MERAPVTTAARESSNVIGGLGAAVTTLGAIAVGMSNAGSAAQYVSVFATGAGGATAIYGYAPSIVEGAAKFTGLFSERGAQRVRSFGKSLFTTKNKPAVTTKETGAAASGLEAIDEEEIGEARYTAHDAEEKPRSPNVINAEENSVDELRGASNVKTYELGGKTVTQVKVASKLDTSKDNIHGVVPW